ncbi:hypothetical protein ACW9IB_04080 [Pseudomonas sp. SDO524_S393]
MNLNLLTLQESDISAKRDGIRVRQLSHHITQIFMELLPKIEINGSSKIVVSLGPRGDEDLFDNVLGVTNIFIENFDFDNFLSMNRVNQDKQLLEELRQALIAIATKREKNSTTVNIINSTADAVLQSHFELETQIKKLSKSSKDKKRKFSVYRIFNSAVGEGWYCKEDSNQKEKTWMHELPSFIDRQDFFKTAEINENGYHVKNRLGKITFEILF